MDMCVGLEYLSVRKTEFERDKRKERRGDRITSFHRYKSCNR